MLSKAVGSLKGLKNKNWSSELKGKLGLEDSGSCNEVKYKEVRPMLCAIFSLKAISKSSAEQGQRLGSREEQSL